MIDFNKKISNSNKFYSYIIPVSLQDACCQNWRFAGIYKITNKINGKCYVGQAVPQADICFPLKKKTYMIE